MRADEKDSLTETINVFLAEYPPACHDFLNMVLTKYGLGTDEGQIFLQGNNIREHCTLLTQQATGLTFLRGSDNTQVTGTSRTGWPDHSLASISARKAPLAN